VALVLTPERMPDAVIATMADLNKGKWIGEMSDIQEHVGWRDFCQKKREQASSGRGITVRYVTDHNHSAQNVGLFNTMEFERTDSMVEGTVPWRWSDANMVFDEREPAMNNGPEEVVDLVKMEQSRAMTAAVELGEENVWGRPEDTADNSTPWGIEYWLTMSTSFGFYGVDHASFTSGRAGVSSTDYPRHVNFTGRYTDVSNTENTGLIYMMEKASDMCRWVAPAPEPGMGRKGYSKAIYTDWTTKMAFKRQSDSNNDSLGWDLSTKTPVFRGAPITYVPYFDSNAAYLNPLYMVDLNHAYAKFLKNWHWKKKVINPLPNQPHCFGIVFSFGYNIVFDDLRRHAAFYKAAA